MIITPVSVKTRPKQNAPLNVLAGHVRDESDKHDIWTVDCETDPFKFERDPEPFIWGAYQIYTGEYLQFDRTEDMLAWAVQGPANTKLANAGKSAKRRRIVYAHNGGKFDWHFIAGYIPLFTPMKVISGRLAKFRIGECEFRDSYNLLPMPLSDYSKIEFDYTKLERDVRHLYRDEIEEYLRDDCEKLADLVRHFIDQHGIKLTLAGAAMAFNEKLTGEKADKTDEAFYTRFYPYYAGGRVQVFEQGEIKRRFVVADINSAYPEAMLHEHPKGATFATWDSIPPELSDAELGRCFLTLETEGRGQFFDRPCNCEHHIETLWPDDGPRLDFPDDGVRRVYHTTGWEYIVARDTGTLGNVRVMECVQFAQSINFKPYVTHWYDKKAKAKKKTPEYIEAKSLMVSLYGKYGANPADYRDFETMPMTYIEAGEDDGWTLENIHGNVAFMSRPTFESQRRYYNVATAASITGYVRAKLWKAIQACKGVIYCDTDAVVATETGTLDIDAVRLGAWDIEAICRRGYVAGKKLYAFELETPIQKDGKVIRWKTANKGVRISPEEIAEIAMGGEVEWKSDAPTFRVGSNTLYRNESIGYVKRPVAYTRRVIRMKRADKQKETETCPPNPKPPTLRKPLLTKKAASAVKPLWLSQPQ